MTRTHPKYPAEFKVEAVRLARSGNRSVAATARELGIDKNTLHLWMKQSAIDAG